MPHDLHTSFFTEELENIIESEFIKNKKLTVVCGDFNINILDLPNGPTIKFVSAMHSRFFIQIINKATRFCSFEGVLQISLDHIWTSSLAFFSSGVIEFESTEHCPTFMNFNLPNVESNIVHARYCFSPFSVENEEKFIESLMERNGDLFWGIMM